MSQKLRDILLCVSLRHVYHVNETIQVVLIPAVLASIVLVGALTRFAFLNFICNLKANIDERETLCILRTYAVRV